MKLLIFVFSLNTLSACNSEKSYKVMSSSLNPGMEKIDKVETATFGTGCFWCTEAIFEQLNGVVKVTSGYMGGEVKNPTYKAVCSGETGHAECVQVVYEPSKISYDELLKVFFEVHDPTSLNRQGADVGTQYRSVIYYHNEEQKAFAEQYKNELNTADAFGKPVVTEISAMGKFFKAENYHQNYFNLNGSQPYCSMVIKPKLEKFKKVFKEKLKKQSHQSQSSF